jgi:hypothetical protein
VKTKHGHGERVEDLMTKQEMRDKGITSPDRADSLAMLYATQSPRFETQSQGAAQESQVVLIPHDAMAGFVG